MIASKLKDTLTVLALIIIVWMLTKLLYHPSTEQFDRLSTEMNLITAGLGEPSDIGHRTNSPGLQFLTYAYDDVNPTVLNRLYSNITSSNKWVEVTLKKEDSVHVLKAYCHEQETLMLSSYEGWLTISIKGIQQPACLKAEEP